MDEPKLTMTFEANTIQHLGVKIYSNMPPVLAELIANAYDVGWSMFSVSARL